MSHAPAGNRVVNMLQEFSIPLIAGVFAALAAANLDPHGYEKILHAEVLGVNLHFLINDIFMVLFFGIAAKEITESCLPGGALNPVKKAINPLMGTIGGVVGPVLVFLGGVHLFGMADRYSNGWGIPTATDIALAWLVARLIFGKGHPAVNFLLLLAVADDAIGLGIIAVFYPDPAHPVAPMWLALTVAGAVAAYAMRRANVRSWQAYLIGPGVMCWLGLHTAHLHPALALCFVVPFMPSAKKDKGLYADSVDEHGHVEVEHDTLNQFEHSLKAVVDFGLFFFAFANAGVAFGDIGPGTWFVLSSLIIGKTIGIYGFSKLGEKLGFPLPVGMDSRHLLIAGMVAGLGLTVALFVSGEAFEGSAQAEAKMGALFSAGAALVAFVAARLLKVRPGDQIATVESDESQQERSLDEAEVLGKVPVEDTADEVALEPTPEETTAS